MTTRQAVRFRFVALACACAGACAPLPRGPRAAGRTTVPGPGSPLSIGLLVDVRPQQGSVLDFERQAVDAVAAGVANAESTGFEIGYADRLEPIADWWRGESGFRDAASRVTIEAGATPTGALLYDGVMDAIEKLAGSGDTGRKVLVVIGEGNDGASTTSFSRVLEAARRRHIVCFAFLVARHRAQVGRVRQFGFDLDRLASTTNGRLYDVRTDRRMLDRGVRDMTTRLRRPPA